MKFAFNPDYQPLEEFTLHRYGNTRLIQLTVLHKPHKVQITVKLALSWCSVLVYWLFAVISTLHIDKKHGRNDTLWLSYARVWWGHSFIWHILVLNTHCLLLLVTSYQSFVSTHAFPNVLIHAHKDFYADLTYTLKRWRLSVNLLAIYWLNTSLFAAHCHGFLCCFWGYCMRESLARVVVTSLL